MIYSFLTSSAPFIPELKQCPIVDKNQVLLYLMQEQAIKACLAAGKYKEDTLLLPFYHRSIKKSLSTFTNIWLNVNIAVLLLILHTINSLLQSRKCKQMETNSLKLTSKSGAELVWKVKKKSPVSLLFRQTKGNSFRMGFISGYLMQVFRKFSCSKDLVIFFFFNLSSIELLPNK